MAVQPLEDAADLKYLTSNLAIRYTPGLYSGVKVIDCKTMPHKKRKISDLTAGDANTLLQALNQFQDRLDDDDEDLPSGLLSALEEFRTKLEAIKVCTTSMFQ